MGFSLGDFLRIPAAIGTFGMSEAVRYGVDKLSQGPDTVNYQGYKLSDDMKDLLDRIREGHDVGGGGLLGTRTHKEGGNPDRASEIFRNWLFGPPIKPLDPTLAFSQANALSGAKTQAGLGMGMSGAFDFGLPKLPSLDLGPMTRGVPYSVPPLPTLRPTMRPS
jgi:hypothetical protein